MGLQANLERTLKLHVMLPLHFGAAARARAVGRLCQVCLVVTFT